MMTIVINGVIGIRQTNFMQPCSPETISRMSFHSCIHSPSKEVQPYKRMSPKNKRANKYRHCLENTFDRVKTLSCNTFDAHKLMVFLVNPLINRPIMKQTMNSVKRHVCAEEIED